MKRQLLENFFVLLLSVTLILSQVGLALADDIPTPPDPPTPPPAPTSIETPPPAPTPPPEPTAPPSNISVSTPAPQTTPTPKPSLDPLSTPVPSSINNTSTNQTSNGNQGDTSLTTGNSTNSGVSQVSINTNSSSSGSSGASANDPVISGNGSSSNNAVNESNNSSSATEQTNSARVGNGLTLSTDTGNNSVSDNVGSSSLRTGNANTTGTSIAAVNTNLAGVGVSEFNVADDHQGDIVLDFAKNCISGCDASSSANIIGNGQNSQNAESVSNATNNTAFQSNDGNVENNLVLAANSGKNHTDDNTGGDSSLTTGNANVSGNLLTFANNNIAGKVLYGVVNVFGNLVGDIVLPASQYGDSSCSSCSDPKLLATIDENGNGSNNNVAVNTLNNGTLTQGNVANIQNNVDANLNTGGNSTNDNTNGNSSLTTGTTNSSVNVLNVANNNLSGGNYLLLIINQAGHIIGELFGPSDSTSSDSADANSSSDTVSGNGSGSNNSVTSSQSQSTSVTQQNNTVLSNNASLSANTGDNSASSNTGGNSAITTGNSNVIASILNFVNNNISSNSKLIVSVVNVFGSWVGSFIGPDGKKIITFGGSQSDNSQTQSQNNSNQSRPNNPTQDSINSTTTSIETDPQIPSINEQSLSTIAFSTSSKMQTSFNDQSSSNVNDTQVLGASKTLVAGFKENTNPSISYTANLAGKKRVTINLAYALLLLPLLLGIYGIRKIALRKRGS